jgi:adenylosuccinate lyase
LERTLDDSANRRTLLPEAFLICDELLRTATRLVKGLKINSDSIARNLAIYAPFASTERLLMALVKSGADRQEMHEHLREHAMRAWEDVRQGKPNPLAESLLEDTVFQRFMPRDQIENCLKVDGYTGIAADRARATAARILKSVEPRV